jgi:hypothetical protein
MPLRCCPASPHRPRWRPRNGAIKGGDPVVMQTVNAYSILLGFWRIDATNDIPSWATMEIILQISRARAALVKYH